MASFVGEKPLCNSFMVVEILRLMLHKLIISLFKEWVISLVHHSVQVSVELSHIRRSERGTLFQ